MPGLYITRATLVLLLLKTSGKNLLKTHFYCLNCWQPSLHWSSPHRHPWRCPDGVQREERRFESFSSTGDAEGCSFSFDFRVILDPLQYTKVILPSQRLDGSTRRRTKAPADRTLRLMSLEVAPSRAPVVLSIPALADQTFRSHQFGLKLGPSNGFYSSILGAVRIYLQHIQQKNLLFRF